MAKLFILKGTDIECIPNNNDLKKSIIDIHRITGQYEFVVSSMYLEEEFGIYIVDDYVDVNCIDIDFANEIQIINLLGTLEELGIMNNGDNTYFVEQ